MKKTEIDTLVADNAHLKRQLQLEQGQWSKADYDLAKVRAALEQSQQELKNAYLFINGLQTSLEQFKTTYRSLTGKG